VIIWGAVWGAIVSVMISRWGEFEWIAGAMLGALAGWTLRRAVRSEMRRATATEPEPAAWMAMPPSTATEPDPVSESDAVSAAMPAMPATPDSSAPSANVIMVAMPAPVAADTRAQSGASDALRAAGPNVIEQLIIRAKNWLLGGNTVARVGTVVLFIGLSFLAKWAADNALFPPEFRLAGIGVVGIALLVQGFWLARANTGDATRAN
jgi:uncharacterized membrane protein